MTRPRWMFLLVASFVPTALKAGTYVTLGSYVPLILFMILAAVASWGVQRGDRAERLAVRLWASAMILWGLARLVLIALFAVTDVSEAHVEGQFTLVYVLWSLLYLVVGVVLFRVPGSRPGGA